MLRSAKREANLPSVSRGQSSTLGLAKRAESADAQRPSSHNSSRVLALLFSDRAVGEEDGFRQEIVLLTFFAFCRCMLLRYWSTCPGMPYMLMLVRAGLVEPGEASSPLYVSTRSFAPLSWKPCLAPGSLMRLDSPPATSVTRILSSISELMTAPKIISAFSSTASRT